MRSERWTIFLAAFASLLLSSEARSQAVRVGKILIVPGPRVVRLIVESDGPPASARGSYLPGAPSTFILDLGVAGTSEAPAVPASEARLIQDVRVQEEGPQNLRILARLSERVPVRLQSEDGRTVVEFAKAWGYLVEADVRARLAGRPKGGIILGGIDPSDSGGRVSFHVELSRPAVFQAFILEKPWRLVADIYDTVLKAKAPSRASEDAQVPVERVRAAQFQMSDPRPITRLVFDLKEPCVYSLEAVANGLVVSFFKNVPVNPSVAPAATPVTAPAREPVLKGERPAKSGVAGPVENPQEPLVRKDLLETGESKTVPPGRDIFRPRFSASAGLFSRPPGPSAAAANRSPRTKEAPAFSLDLVYVGLVRSGGKIVALVMAEGQTMPVAEGDEITPGYKVLRITDTEIEVEGPNALRKTFVRQGDRP
jgi:hypothetical protein